MKSQPIGIGRTSHNRIQIEGVGVSREHCRVLLLAEQPVLLDLGSYRYLETGTVMRDRASPIGERGSTDTGDLSGVVERFGSQHYK